MGETKKEMTDYHCETCGVITIIDDDKEDWFTILTKHHNNHVSEKSRYGMSYRIRRFAYAKYRCVRSNCDNEGIHHVRSGDFGCSYCDKHWKERDTEVEGRLLMG